ncbi:7747_t:CDS:2, partial [Ambispora gerdemannii]
TTLDFFATLTEKTDTSTASKKLTKSTTRTKKMSTRVANKSSETFTLNKSRRTKNNLIVLEEGSKRIPLVVLPPNISNSTSNGQRQQHSSSHKENLVNLKEEKQRKDTYSHHLTDKKTTNKKSDSVTSLDDVFDLKEVGNDEHATTTHLDEKRAIGKDKNYENLDASVNELIKNLRSHYKVGAKSKKINEKKIHQQEEILSNKLKNLLKFHLEKICQIIDENENNNNHLEKEYIEREKVKEDLESSSLTPDQKATSILSNDPSDSSIQSLPPPLKLSFELPSSFQRKDHEIQYSYTRSEDILKNPNYGFSRNLDDDEVPLAGEKERIYFQNHHDKSSINQFNISSVNNQIIKEQQSSTLEVDDKQPQSVFSEKQIGEAPQALSMPKIVKKNKKKESIELLKPNFQGNVKNSVIPDEGIPDYTHMTLEELKVAVSKYGIRPSSRNIMIKQLQTLWESLSKINTGNLDTSNSVSRRANILSERQKKQSADPIIKSVVTYDDEKNDEALSESSSDDDDLPLLDLIDSFDIMSGEYPLEEDIAKQINDYICSNKRLWLSILEYQDINFDQTLRDLNNAGINCNSSQLRAFMDSQAIISKSNEGTNKWKSKKKTPKARAKKINGNKNAFN